MQHKAKWWRLYAIIPLSAGLLWLDSQLTLQPQGHQLLEIGIVLLSFGWMAGWVHFNRTAIVEEAARRTKHIVVLGLDRAQALEQANWQHSQHAGMAEQGPVDLQGRHN